VYPGFNIGPLRYYLRRDFCAIPPSSIVEIDGQAIGAARIFVVLSKAKAPEIDRVRAVMNHYGREAEHFEALRIAIIQYQRIVGSR
jgi:hypothetical protein